MYVYSPLGHNWNWKLISHCKLSWREPTTTTEKKSVPNWQVALKISIVPCDAGDGVAVAIAGVKFLTAGTFLSDDDGTERTNERTFAASISGGSLNAASWQNHYTWPEHRRQMTRRLWGERDLALSLSLTLCGSRDWLIGSVSCEREAGMGGGWLCLKAV